MQKNTIPGNWMATSTAVAIIILPLAMFIRWIMVFFSYPELSPQGKANLYEYALPEMMKGRGALAVIMIGIPLVSIALSVFRRDRKGFAERMLNLGTIIVAVTMILLTAFSLL